MATPIDAATRLLQALLLALLLTQASCRTIAVEESASRDIPRTQACEATEPCRNGSHSSPLRSAQRWASRAAREYGDRKASEAWLHCATDAYAALASTDDGVANSAAALANRCTDGFLSLTLNQQSRGWSQGSTRVGNTELMVSFRGLSPYLQPPLQLKLARDISMAAYGGERHALSGFGVPLAVLTPRCKDAPLCGLLPPEGVFRNATAWIEADPAPGALPRLVLADPLLANGLQAGNRTFRLASDTSAAYARGVQTSKLHRLAIWGLVGGHEVGRRAGLYLLEDYDPNKRPLVMIHGLGSSPLTWARLSNAVWGDPDLRRRFQVWHVVYQTNAPLLVTRRRIQNYLDDAWSVLDPERDDPARSSMVLVGHSLGGVLARMLCVDSGDVLWNAAFVVPPEALRADAADRRIIEEIFRFSAYPGIGRAIFVAAPHRGSPAAMSWFGRLARVVVGRRTTEMQSLRRIARANPEAIRPELLRLYQRGEVNSISTLQSAQLVRRAGEGLMPVAGIPYHTIAGALPGRRPETDGVVPLQSALLDGATSTLVVSSGHAVHESQQGVAEILRILREY